MMKKAAIYFVMIITTQLDRIANTEDFIRTSTAFFFIANEGLSIIENIDELGVKLPKFLITHLQKLRVRQDQVGAKKSEGNKGEE